MPTLLQRAPAAAAWFAAGAACGAAGLAVFRRLLARRGARRIKGKDFRGAASSYLYSECGVTGLLAYDIDKSMTKDGYDQWLFGKHYHDLLSNPDLDCITLHTVSTKRPHLSSGAFVENELNFARLAELRFRDTAAFDRYVAWFKENVVPADRTAAGKSRFKFYHLASSQLITKDMGRLASASGAVQAEPGTTPPDAVVGRRSRSLSGNSWMEARPSEKNEMSFSNLAGSTVLVVGAGNIGLQVARRLRKLGATVVTGSRRRQGHTVQLDIANLGSVRALDKAFPGGFEHVVVCCGASTFGPIESFDTCTWDKSCAAKFLAVSRFAVMLAGGKEVSCLRDGGSITVTTGQTSKTLNRMWPGLAANNAGLDAFVRNAGLEVPRGVRINAVAPALVRETAVAAGLELEGTVPAEEVAYAYLPLICGTMSGVVAEVGWQEVFSKTHQTS